MDINHLVLGAFETNCYILRKGETTKDCLLVDTGLEAGELINFLERHKLNPAAVALTHGHADHVGGVAALRKNFPDIKVYIHKLDAKMLTEANSNMSVFAGEPLTTEPADFFLRDGDVIEQAGIKLKVLHTPGHTQGGICLYSKDERIVFTDDTLFAGSVGRTDLPGANSTQLIKSIKEKLFTLPDETVCFPGHGPSTTISQQKANNPFLQ